MKAALAVKLYMICSCKCCYSRLCEGLEDESILPLGSRPHRHILLEYDISPLFIVLCYVSQVAQATFCHFGCETIYDL